MKWLRRPTKRTLLKAVLFIVGGAIINVAVAWGCAARGQAIHLSKQFRVPFAEQSESLDCFDKEWLRRAGWRQRTEGDCTFPAVLLEVTQGFGFMTRGYAEGKVPRSIDDAFFCQGLWAYSVFAEQFRAGWPLKSMLGGSLISTKEFIDTVEWSSEQHSPTRPLWPGFGINTIFYAGILWMMFTAPGFVRRRIRIMRHRCPACGYLVGTSPVCTECGTPVRIQKP